MSDLNQSEFFSIEEDDGNESFITQTPCENLMEKLKNSENRMKLEIFLD